MGLSRKVEDLERFEEILQILFKQELGYVLDRLDLEDRLPVAKQMMAKRHRKPGPVRVRETFEELGPVYIKFGQMLAERKDLIPERYAEELKKLEGDVKPFDPERAQKIVDADIGMEKLENFEKKPMASASIAQVHRATLKSGEEVVVKVRRPGIVEQAENDLDILHYLARRAEKLRGIGHHQLSRDVEQFADWTRKEMDFTREAGNGKTLKENLSDWDRIRVPKIYEDISTERVLVTEYIDAVRCDDIEAIKQMDLDFSEIAEIGVKAEMEQIFEHGFFHADPHPSNFLVDTDGRLVYIDFGIMGRLTRKKRKETFLMFYSMAKGNPDGVMDSLLKLSYVDDDAEIEELRALVEREMKDLQGTSIGQKSVTTTFAKISMESTHHGVFAPNDLIMMGKGMATMEGIGLDLYPDYNFAEQNEEFLEKLMRDQLDPKESAEQLTIDVLRNREMFENMPSRVNKLMEDHKQKIIVKNQNSPDSLVPGLLIASSVFLAISLPEKYGIAAGAAGLALAFYLHGR